MERRGFTEHDSVRGASLGNPPGCLGMEKLMVAPAEFPSLLGQQFAF